MTSKLDNLLLLLDTGSSTSLRTTAAQNIAQIAAKAVSSDVTFDEDVKTTRHVVPRSDPAAWTELMSVVARILPYLSSKSHDTRSAASVALSHICTLVGVWRPQQEVKTEDAMEADSSLPTPEFPNFSIEELMQKGTLLLSSSGKEYIRPAGLFADSAEVKKAKKEAMKRLGLDFLETVGDDDMDIEKELAVGAEDAEMDTKDALEDGRGIDAKPPGVFSPIPAQVKEDSPAPLPDSPTPENDLSLMSARERNRLKRKRRPGNSAFVAAPAPTQGSGSKYNAMASSSSGKVRLVEADETPPLTPRGASPHGTSTTNGGTPDKVVIDPSKGGAVSPKAAQQTKALEVEPGCWVWDGLVKILEVELFSPAWESRHGAAMALREILKVQGSCGGMQDGLSPEDNALEHELWCNELAIKLLCIFTLDRFGDFVSDQVVAPVRETVSQTLASLLLHMPRGSLLSVHRVLLQMIRQNFPIPPRSATQHVTARGRPGQPRDLSHVWEVRHAGLLGIKYEVAVRPDLFKPLGEDLKVHEGGDDVLRDVVDAAMLGLGDRDDDVRSVAASCLLPVAEHVVNQLPGELPRVLGTLWNCLAEMKDDLSSSVGAVMDLLGKLVSYDAVIAVLADKDKSLPITELAPTLYPFFRHTIPNVRLAVVNTLYAFMVVSSLSRGWIALPLLRLLMQNLVVEERADIREATLATWQTTLGILTASPEWIQQIVVPQVLLEWYTMVMTPMGVPIDTTSFYTPSLDDDVPERHNVDKNMLVQDLALVTVESVFKTRIAAATALAHLILMWPERGQTHEDLFSPFLPHYIDSASMLQKFLAAIIVEEWAREHDKRDGEPPLIEASPLAKELSAKTLGWLEAGPPAAYHEMAILLSRLHGECHTLLQSFAIDFKLPAMSIPTIGNTIDLTGADSTAFNIETAKAATGPIFTALKDLLGKRKAKDLAPLTDKRDAIDASIKRYFETKAEYDTRVSAAFAAAFISLKSTPDKVTPLVKGIMNGIKNEENIDLQTRSAAAVANFVNFCAHHKLSQPPEKIVKNLCTFLCQDVERTPTFAFTRKQTTGILSFQPPSRGSNANGKAAPEKEKQEISPLDAAKARISRRGAGLAFDQLSTIFGSRLLEVIPGMWHSIVGGLLSACKTDDPNDSDALMGKQFGQDVIDSLSVLEAVLPSLHQDLWSRIVEIFPKLLVSLRSRYAIVRQSAARCFATVCSVMTTDGMRFVIENVIPLLGDSVSLSNRQGSTELMFHIVQKLEIKALPYVIFMIVPVLGRMSDSDDDVRATASNTFASLVKMVPLEAGLPDPPDFSEELLKRRDTERRFLSQLLDGSKKVEPYKIPVKINAELRSYQQDGVNWLAFLAKYQLHGILCDDMGLGKTLQSICILAGKHHERAERFKETKSPDAVHLPSLIVCPPTLTGHWYYEIKKYAESLTPIQYVGNARDRNKLLPKLKNYDIVITSYEVVRNDITHLEKLAFNYCILDEGHIIKNAKTKLTKAVKCIRADHRLVLSGTPIQNHALDLWSLFDFLMPGFLGTEGSFNERFSKPILANRDGKNKNGEAAALALEALHKQVLPFLLRRLKEEVLHDLPPKIIQDYFCDLSDLQRHLYDDFSKSQAGVSAEQAVQGDKNQQHVFQSLQYLRKLCNHPSLVLKNDTKAISTAFAKACGQPEKQKITDIQHAPKLLALRQLLNDCGIGLGASPEAKGESSSEAMSSSGGTFSQHRALIFCQMKQMIDLIESDLFKQHMPGVTYMRFDGGTPADKRHAIVQTFNSDPSIDCLLLTTHVGGLGLTLTGADTVIFVEHDWNPMKDLQAMDRAHRIGQKKVVNVYRLITKGTLEEKIMGLQRFKLNIAHSVVTQQNSGLASMDTDLVLDLFKRTSEEDDARAAAKKKAKETAQPVTTKNVLHGLDELPPEDEYESLDLSNFMSSLGR